MTNFKLIFSIRYNSFYEKYAGLPFSKHPEKYVKFTPAEVSSQIDSFFDAAAWNIFYIAFTFVVPIVSKMTRINLSVDFQNDLWLTKLSIRLAKLSLCFIHFYLPNKTIQT